MLLLLFVSDTVKPTAECAVGLLGTGTVQQQSRACDDTLRLLVMHLIRQLDPQNFRCSRGQRGHPFFYAGMHKLLHVSMFG